MAVLISSSQWLAIIAGLGGLLLLGDARPVGAQVSTPTPPRPPVCPTGTVLEPGVAARLCVTATPSRTPTRPVSPTPSRPATWTPTIRAAPSWTAQPATRTSTPSATATLMVTRTPTRTSTPSMVAVAPVTPTSEPPSPITPGPLWLVPPLLAAGAYFGIRALRRRGAPRPEAGPPDTSYHTRARPPETAGVEEPPVHGGTFPPPPVPQAGPPESSLPTANGHGEPTANGHSEPAREVADAHSAAAVQPHGESDDWTHSERVVNTGFAPEDRAGDPLDPSTPLATGQRCYFWLEVGAPLVASIEETPTSLPVEHLPAEARLSVVLFDFDDELQIDHDADIGELQLQPDNSVRVTRQPVRPRSISTNEDLLRRRMFFAVRAPSTDGTYHLRCNIYFEQVLVQSRLVSARVMTQPEPTDRALSSTLDYTLSQSLTSAHLTGLAPHKLSLMLNESSDGTHGFRFVGQGEFKSSASFGEDELQDLIEQARRALRLAAWGDENPWQSNGPYGYRYVGPRDEKRLSEDLIRFAIRGYRFYDAIINRLAGGVAKADSLSELMTQPGFVQIALKDSARHVLPAALIYDQAFDTNAHIASFQLCPAFLGALDAPQPLEEQPCFKGSCPSRDADTIICPSGFWGFRHALGMPLSIAGAPDVPTELRCESALQFAVGVSTDPAFVERAQHETRLQQLRAGSTWGYGDSRDEVFALLKDSAPHLVYLYCHGGVANKVPYVQVGPLSEPGITPDNLRAKRIRWKSPRPLVFINGCHTTALEPEAALEFVTAFVGTAGASGVIGTEVTIFEPLARAFAEECLRRFLDGTPIGEAVRGARLALLKEGNPLGLVYIPFVLASLTLVDGGP